MKYFATRSADSSEAETIKSQVAFYKTDTFIRNKYMTYEYDLHQSKEEGRAEGVAEGIAKAKADMAKGFRNAGISLEIISKQTGFTIEEIKAL